MELPVFLCFVCILFAVRAEESDNSTPIDRYDIHQPHHQGLWKKGLVWRPRWVKTWQERKVYVAVWKKMWGPIVLKEWLPLPKPPPGWVKHSSGTAVVKLLPH